MPFRRASGQGSAAPKPASNRPDPLQHEPLAYGGHDFPASTATPRMPWEAPMEPLFSAYSCQIRRHSYYLAKFKMPESLKLSGIFCVNAYHVPFAHLGETKRSCPFSAKNSPLEKSRSARNCLPAQVRGQAGLRHTGHIRLMLLPSGPDMVHSGPLHRARLRTCAGKPTGTAKPNTFFRTSLL